MQPRLAKYLALCGLGSRRHACRLIDAGLVTFNGRPASHRDRVSLDGHETCLDDIRVAGVRLRPPQAPSYWLFNKPVGVDCRLLAQDPCSLLHLLPAGPRLYPVGRLDKDSRGLLLLTNDGELTHSLMHPDFGHSKTYHVRLNLALDAAFLTQMAQGVSYKGISTLPCDTRRLTDDSFEIVLTQGLNRQIRRMSQALGYRVMDLQRVALMRLELGDLAEGQMRPLTEQEIAGLVHLKQAKSPPTSQ
ncbi:23S rRNA pseudouridine(2604) synthase RluF [Shewanella salipaludis]|uniref:Pseudouridine synthase n=1 Tax=Shewanella salipaludis TaxID=2723052 RepID=A0A972FZ43_9GAMM|nr:23S rRNA pseudouridine(2604) synthase RluF [Shewanella salipaludis]NMH65863.1 pseudouridine synthase [Shewanella salipaludis]